jgi:hypothetical protein
MRRAEFAADVKQGGEGEADHGEDQRVEVRERELGRGEIDAPYEGDE